jgi:hypothetical protein
VISTGSVAGIAETLYAIPREAIDFSCTELRSHLDEDALRALVPLDGGDWPAAISPRRSAG